MGKIFKINSKEILSIAVNLVFNQFKIKLKNKAVGKQVLKSLKQYKRIQNRDSEMSFQFTCSIIGKTSIVVRGLGLKDALESLNLSHYIPDKNYQLISKFIDKNTLELTSKFFSVIRPNEIKKKVDKIGDSNPKALEISD